MPVLVITDTASGLPREDIERLGIRIVPLYIQEGGVSRPETEYDLAALYSRLEAGPLSVTTSQPAPSDFADAFRNLPVDGAIAVLLSGNMSSTLRAAGFGLQLAREEAPGTRVVFVDSESNSMQEGFAALAAAECAATGGDLAACEAAARASIARSRFLFAPRSLKHLAQGGRIGAAVALLGSAIRIVPILTAAEGTTGVAAVSRTYSNALARIAALMRRDVERAGLKRVVVQAIAQIDHAAQFARELIEPIAGRPVPVVPVAASIGVHVGPAIGVAYETIEPLRQSA